MLKRPKIILTTLEDRKSETNWPKHVSYFQPIIAPSFMFSSFFICSCCYFLEKSYAHLLNHPASSTLNKIYREKEKHTWSVQIISEILSRGYGYGTDDRIMAGGKPSDDVDINDLLWARPPRHGPVEKKEAREEDTPIMLTAAKYGVKEIVEKILEIFPEAIHETDGDGKNIGLLAVEYRQLQLYQLLLKRNVLNQNLFRKADNNGNSALHLAAKLGDYKPWLIPSPALQMQWEIKWFEFVRESLPPHLFVQRNEKDQTPEDIFTDTHRDLVENGGLWMNKISESCSVVAALIATVAFATTAAVPGGVQESSGHPTLENDAAFDVYAISSLVAVFSSVTSVIMFLSLLTSRHQQHDFVKDLPWKLLVALTSMFLSIASMLVSFCTAHFFMVKHKLRYSALPLYFAASLPVILFALRQLPLYFDYLWATFKKVPQHRWYRITPPVPSHIRGYVWQME